ncbi:MAG: hypothetical protein ABGX51_01975, partial [Gammaproteobacteria bacterium]
GYLTGCFKEPCSGVTSTSGTGPPAGEKSCSPCETPAFAVFKNKRKTITPRKHRPMILKDLNNPITVIPFKKTLRSTPTPF